MSCVGQENETLLAVLGHLDDRCRALESANAELRVRPLPRLARSSFVRTCAAELTQPVPTTTERALCC